MSLDLGANSSKPPVPFGTSRLTNYGKRLESLFDPKMSVANAIAMASLGAPATPSLRPAQVRQSLAALPTLAGDPPGVGLLETSPPRSAPTSAPTSAGTVEMSAALRELQALKAEMAGVETVLGYLKSPEPVSVLGRKQKPLSTQQQLRQRADALIRSQQEAPLREAGVKLFSGSVSAPASRGRHLSPLRDSESAFDMTLADGGHHGTSRWRPARGAAPVGRGEAVLLEGALDEMLPEGAIAAKYRLAALGRGTASQLFLEQQDIRQDWEMLDMVGKEVARQISSTCAERGRIVAKLTDRQGEVFVVLLGLAHELNEAKIHLTTQLGKSQRQLQQQALDHKAVEDDLAAAREEVGQLRYTLEAERDANEAFKSSSEDQLMKLEGQNNLLAAEVDHYVALLEAAHEEKDVALRAGLERLEEELAAVHEERDDLLQRIRFLERQLMRHREELNRVVPSAHVACQTDPVEFSTEEPEMQLAEEVAPPIAEESSTPGPGPTRTSMAVGKKKKTKKKRNLGGFGSMFHIDKPGKIRGRQWVLSCLTQIYYDKVISDIVADREGNPRLRLCEFIYDWHITKYGLRNLAELNLLDLIVSVRSHYRTSQRIKLFAQFCALVEEGMRMDSPQHASFYLFSLQQLAYPAAITVLLPDDDDKPVTVSLNQVVDALKAIFKYLNDVDADKAFLARYQERLLEPTQQFVELDPLITLLMQEFQTRVERNMVHLKVLFRAGDMDNDGAIGYDEFMLLVKYADPDMQERTMVRMYQEALNMVPDGFSMVNCNAFVAVLRQWGLDRWKVDVGAAPRTTSSSGPPPKSPDGSSTTTTTAPRQLFALLNSSIEALDPPLEELLRMIRDKVDEPETVVRLEEQYRHFRMVLGAMRDPELAWLTFRLLLTSITGVMNRHKLGDPGFRRMLTREASSRGSFAASPSISRPISPTREPSSPHLHTSDGGHPLSPTPTGLPPLPPKGGGSAPFPWRLGSPQGPAGSYPTSIGSPGSQKSAGRLGYAGAPTDGPLEIAAMSSSALCAATALPAQLYASTIPATGPTTVDRLLEATEVGRQISSPERLARNTSPLSRPSSISFQGREC